MRVLHNLHTIDIGVGDVGVTVRNGSKWADSDGETIVLCECGQRGHVGCHIVGTGVVENIWSGAFRDIPARFIELEHELSSRTYSGLMRSMQRAYGKEFGPNNSVTVVVYRRTPTE